MKNSVMTFAICALALSFTTTASASPPKYEMVQIDPSIETQIAIVKPGNQDPLSYLYLATDVSGLNSNYENLFPVCGGKKIELLTKFYTTYERWIKERAIKAISKEFQKLNIEIQSIETKLVGNYIQNADIVNNMKTLMENSQNPDYAYSYIDGFSQSEAYVNLVVTDVTGVTRVFQAQSYGLGYDAVSLNVSPIRKIVKNSLGDVVSSNIVCSMLLKPWRPDQVKLYLYRLNANGEVGMSLGDGDIDDFSDVQAEVVISQ